MFGRREELVMGIVNCIDNYRRNIQFNLNLLFRKDLRKEMSKNRSLKNIHSGKRCFIVGNGPSLKHYDLSKLTNEYIFTVNYMMKSAYFETLRPNYHFLVDPNIFTLNPNDKIDNDKIQAIHNSIDIYPDIEFFIPYKKKQLASTIIPKAKINYIYNNKIFTPRLKKPYCLDKNTPIFQNVILYAIITALYMGFKDIYLLGVDMTGFLENFEYKKINEKWGHIYKKTKEEYDRQIENKLKRNYDNEFYLKQYGKNFEEFKLLQIAAFKKDVRLLNASSHGALDVLDRVHFDEIFADNNN